MTIDTIRLIYPFKNNFKVFIDTCEYLESNFELAYNELNPENKMNDTKLFKLYYVKNLKIRLYTNRVVLIGSIPKYYKNNNLKELTYKEIKEAFNTIQFLLPFVNWYDSIVSRLDIGPCLNLPFNSDRLVQYITGSKYCKKTVFMSNGITIIIGNKSHQFEIYNKSSESKEAEENTSRLEYKMLKASVVGKRFNRKVVTLDFLLNNLIKLPEIWYKMYENLEKDYRPDFSFIKNKNELNHAAYHYMGYENCIRVIENSYKLNKISDTQRDNMKRYIRRLQKSGESKALPNSPMLTLDNIVNQYMIEQKKLGVNS